MRLIISIAIGLVTIVLIIMYCCLVIASNSDDYEEIYFKNMKQETDKNEMDKEIIGEEKMTNEQEC